MADSLDSINRPRLPLPDRELVKLSVVEDLTMKTGFVRVRIVVDELGKVTRPAIETGLGAREDSLAMSRVRNLPDFVPGTINGRPVKVVYFLPFVLNPNGGNTPGER